MNPTSRTRTNTRIPSRTPASTASTRRGSVGSTAPTAITTTISSGNRTNSPIVNTIV